MISISLVRRVLRYGKDLWPQFISQIRCLHPSSEPDKYKHSVYRIIVSYHVIEKGLTMPSPKAGFGQKVVKSLCILCKDYCEAGYQQSNVHFTHAVRVLNEYLEFNKRIHFSIEPELEHAILELQTATGIMVSSSQEQQEVGEFFQFDKDAIEHFFTSRRTIRNYLDTPIEKHVLDSCIRIAQSAPSSCNRQPVRVYAITNPELKSQVLSIHNGNRGFGHLAPMLLVVTSDQNSMMGFNERNDGYINAGLFTMNLVHALRLHGIGNCILNWSVLKDKDKKMRRLVGLNDSEIICLLLTIGYVPDTFYTAVSPRNAVDDVLTVIS